MCYLFISSADSVSNMSGLRMCVMAPIFHLGQAVNLSRQLILNNLYPLVSFLRVYFRKYLFGFLTQSSQRVTLDRKCVTHKGGTGQILSQIRNEIFYNGLPLVTMAIAGNKRTPKTVFKNAKLIPRAQYISKHCMNNIELSEVC